MARKTRFLALTFALFLTGMAIASAPTLQRIIPLQPSIAEVLVAMDVPIEQIVGVVDYTDFPPELKSRPKVGTYDRPNLELIVGLKPDLVISSQGSSPPDLSKRLARSKIRTLDVSIQTLRDLFISISTLGSVLGREKSAAKLKTKIEGELSQIETFYRTKPLTGKKVLIQVGDQPLVVAGRGSVLNDALSLLGLENVYQDLDRPYARVSREDVIRRNPDVIVVLGMSTQTRDEEKAAQVWHSFKKIKAVQQSRVRALRSDAILRAGPRFPMGVADLGAAIFGVGYEIKSDRS